MHVEAAADLQQEPTTAICQQTNSLSLDSSSRPRIPNRDSESVIPLGLGASCQEALLLLCSVRIFRPYQPSSFSALLHCVAPFSEHPTLCTLSKCLSRTENLWRRPRWPSKEVTLTRPASPVEMKQIWRSRGSASNST